MERVTKPNIKFAIIFLECSKSITSIFIVLLFMLFSNLAVTHGNAHKNEEKNSKNILTNQIVDRTISSGNKGEDWQGKNDAPNVNINTELYNLFTENNIPTWHPFIVHAPIIFIPTAFILFLFSCFTAKKIRLISFIIGVAGLIGGYIAAFPLHPHTINLPNAALQILQLHDLYAYSTLILMTVALLLFIVQFVINRYTRIFNILIALFLFLASLSIAITGHYGGSLVYLHGVGVQGKYLEKAN